jgi:two-component sensor histidine kinase
LAELLQNAVEHAFLDRADDEPGAPASSQPVGHIQVNLVNDLVSLTLEVADDGSGLPAGFNIDETQSLGLSIVRDLVRSQLDGIITMRNRSETDPGARGTVVAIEVPVQEPHKVGL